MPKFKRDDLVKIGRHPKSYYCGREDKMFEMREGSGPTTHGVTNDGTLPRLGKQMEVRCSDRLPS